MTPRPMDFGAMETIAQETWHRFAWAPILRAAVLWTAIFFAALYAYDQFFRLVSKTFQPEKITADFVAFRRASFFGAIIATTGLGVWLLWKSFLPEGISALEWVQLVLFLLLFQQIATGFWLAVFGFITAIAGGDRAQIARTIDEADLSAPTPPTAVVIPIYNEDVVRVFGGIEAMWQGLKDAGGNEGFDFFI